MMKAAPLKNRVGELTERYGHLDGAELLAPVIEDEFPGRVALVSSFGTEAAVLLALMAEVDPATPVIFLDTGKLFGETLRYRDRLATLLGLRDVRTIEPEPEILRQGDPNGLLWRQDANACCRLRKVLPLETALEGFDAWITGRKRYQSTQRGALTLFETEGERIKVNPLAGWDRERIEDEFARRNLPRHPLEADGFLSVGCMPCTDRVAPGEAIRSGRWRGLEKTECGIHLPLFPAAAAADSAR